MASKMFLSSPWCPQLRHAEAALWTFRSLHEEVRSSITAFFKSLCLLLHALLDLQDCLRFIIFSSRWKVGHVEFQILVAFSRGRRGCRRAALHVVQVRASVLGSSFSTTASWSTFP